LRSIAFSSIKRAEFYEHKAAEARAKADGMKDMEALLVASLWEAMARSVIAAEIRTHGGNGYTSAVDFDHRLPWLKSAGHPARQVKAEVTFLRRAFPGKGTGMQRCIG
jgi:alkylation response protein AidB-like acyl-CoA dehydrogenase